MKPVRLLLDVCFFAVFLTAMTVAMLVFAMIELLEWLYEEIKGTCKALKAGS